MAYGAVWWQINEEDTFFKNYDNLFGSAIVSATGCHIITVSSDDVINVIPMYSSLLLCLITVCRKKKHLVQTLFMSLKFN